MAITDLCLSFICILSVANASLPRISSRQHLPGLRLSWRNCGPSSDPIQLNSLQITPDPIRIPGNLTIDGSAGIASALPTDIRAAVLLERKVGPFFVKVPCVNNFGSCTYNNVCELWSEICPQYAQKLGLPCECPIPANVYSVSNANVWISRSVPPEFLGEYRATADISSSESHLGCVFIDLTVRNRQ